MATSIYSTLKKIVGLWKETFLPLLPFTISTVVCFESFNFSNSIVVSILLSFPGLYFSNVILLKLAYAFRQKPLNIQDMFSIALARYFNSLLLFVGLGAIFIFCVIATLSFSILFGVTVALLLLIFYSYMIFSYPLVVIDNMDPFQAIKKSFHLLNNHVGYITAIFLIVGCLQGILYVILFFIMGEVMTSWIYNFLFTTLNLALSVVVLESLKQQTE